MKALILNSSAGSRMGILTSEPPKRMTEISTRKTILARQLKLIVDADVEEAIKTTGYYDDVLVKPCQRLDLPIPFTFVNNPELEPEKVVLCPNIADIQDVSVDVARNAIRARYGDPQEIKVFAHGGNLNSAYGTPFIVEWLRRQHESRAFFLIVGSGSEYARLERYAHEEVPQNFKLLSKLPKRDYKTLVAACDFGMIFLDHRFPIPNYPNSQLSNMKAKPPIFAVVDYNSDAFGSLVRESAEKPDEEISSMKEREIAFLQKRYTHKSRLQLEFKPFWRVGNISLKRRPKTIGKVMKIYDYVEGLPNSLIRRRFDSRNSRMNSLRYERLH